MYFAYTLRLQLLGKGQTATLSTGPWVARCLRFRLPNPQGLRVIAYFLRPNCCSWRFQFQWCFPCMWRITLLHLADMKIKWNDINDRTRHAMTRRGIAYHSISQHSIVYQAGNRSESTDVRSKSLPYPSAPNDPLPGATTERITVRYVDCFFPILWKQKHQIPQSSIFDINVWI